MLFKKDNETGEVTVPEGFMIDNKITSKKYFKIVVQEVTETSTIEVEDVYIHIENGSIIRSYDYEYGKLEEEEKAKYVKVKRETGKININQFEKELLSQSKEELNVADVALYINRGGDN